MFALKKLILKLVETELKLSCSLQLGITDNLCCRFDLRSSLEPDVQIRHVLLTYLICIRLLPGIIALFHIPKYISFLLCSVSFVAQDMNSATSSRPGKAKTQTYLLSASSWKCLLTKPRQKSDPSSKQERIFSVTSGGILIQVDFKQSHTLNYIIAMIEKKSVLKFHLSLLYI